jgi:hypothetical protein
MRMEKEREANGFVKTENGNALTENGVHNGGYAVNETEFISHL